MRTFELTADRVRRGLVPALLVGALVSAGCDVAMSGFREEATDTWSRSYPLTSGGQVEIGNTNGFIEVTTGTGQTVEVKAVRIARAGSSEGAAAMLKETKIRGEITTGSRQAHERAPTLQPGARRSRGPLFGLGAGLGARESHHDQRAHWRDQRHRRLATGDHQRRDSGKSLGGPVKASTTNGSVELEVATLTADVSVETTNGSVNLRVPTDAKATISTRWTNGGVELKNLTVEETEKSKRRFDGRMNGGGSRIDIETTNGGITLGSL